MMIILHDGRPRFTPRWRSAERTPKRTDGKSHAEASFDDRPGVPDSLAGVPDSSTGVPDSPAGVPDPSAGVPDP